MFKFFKKEEKPIIYAEIDFTETAKERVTLDRNNIKIFIKEGTGSKDDEIIDVLDYNSYNLRKLEERRIPIIRTLEVPRIDLKKKLLLGRILIAKSRGLFEW
jgi:hypothetical protein